MTEDEDRWNTLHIVEQMEMKCNNQLKIEVFSHSHCIVHREKLKSMVPDFLFDCSNLLMEKVDPIFLVLRNWFFELLTKILFHWCVSFHEWMLILEHSIHNPSESNLNNSMERSMSDRRKSFCLQNFFSTNSRWKMIFIKITLKFHNHYVIQQSEQIES